MDAVHQLDGYFLQVDQLFLLPVVVGVLLQVSVESAHQVDDGY